MIPRWVEDIGERFFLYVVIVHGGKLVGIWIIFDVMWLIDLLVLTHIDMIYFLSL